MCKYTRIRFLYRQNRSQEEGKMARRGNNIYHRADGRWEGRYYCKGTRKYKSVYGKTYTEAKEKLDRIRNEALVPSAKCHLLLSDILKMWLESRRNYIKESSYAGYRNKLEGQIIPYFGDLKYNRLDQELMERFIADKKVAGLSEKYITDMVVMVKSAAKWAERIKNYANRIRNVELPKSQPKEIAVFSQDEQKKLLRAIMALHNMTACGVLLALYTGLRIGELCALQWRDIDFNTGIMHIKKTVQRIRVYGDKSKTAVKVTAPKSVSSFRDIPLPEFLITLLLSYRGEEQSYIASGSTALIEPRSFTNRYKALLKKAGVPSRKFHCLRHSFSTSALQLGFDIKTLSEILGHASANITMRVYVHSSMERKSACMNRLQALI